VAGHTLDALRSHEAFELVTGSNPWHPSATTSLARTIAGLVLLALAMVGARDLPRLRVIAAGKAPRYACLPAQYGACVPRCDRHRHGMAIEHRSVALLTDSTRVIDWLEDSLDTGSWQNPFGFLSNFHAHVFEIDGVRYGSAEHYYQAAKALDASWHARIAAAATPAEAKALGKQCPARDRIEWNAMKFDVMTQAVRLKFADPGLAAKLLATGTAYIQEGTFWHDDEWGVDLLADPGADPLRRPGKNYVGVILMAERARLQALAAA
jgi:ribA/ribD-fused uncharacterized protein